ncbi:nucleoside-diphosphate-sugar epimerase [Renibacterium salmoninarum ATCC 33209]|uniref:Nucleoside-diphosphate-sugar epimerase n=1 Tax=Renibacterium salmoninarum (strain ATCC 33209 / DSM 20767 / JCM 11484 / NBRC 15589 / NCIMB 2235) TaxID=288705 RepID=A9WRV6_RENSM|nr:NAD(P)H-binding protein [Renibacterium salmoninarum]ABY24388.1 nucleoside-diphosphate-sugar epimerase [Renibacterium salmoninarum ATCC 33209]
MNHAVILGGTGALGRATASKLLSEGWTVDVVGRNAENFPAELREAGATFQSADRYNSTDLQTVFGAGADLLVDALSFNEAHAKMLLPHLAGFSSTVMLSSKAVYQDEQGRHANSDEPPQFSGPISEEQATLPAQNSDFASREGYGPNKVAAE